MPTELNAMAGTLVAALVAGLLSYWAGRGMKTHEWRLMLAKDELATRRVLYADFLAEAQRLIVKAVEERLSSVEFLDKLNRQYAEISLFGTDQVVDAASDVFDAVLLAHQRVDQNAEEGMQFFPRKQAFLAAARTELQVYKRL